MIQAIITRMSGNLFLLKGWAVTLIVALFAIIVKDLKGEYILFVFCILFIFWLLDGYFLSMERCFRGLYDEVRIKDEQDIDFSMNFIKHLKGKNTWIKSMFSKTLLIFYGTLLIAFVIVIAMSKFNIKLNLNLELKNNSYQATTTIVNTLRSK